MLNDQNRNRNLNAAYLPQWDEAPFDLASALPAVAVPQGDTNFDPFLGTGWGEFLDAIGASDPGGARVRGGSLPRSPVATSQQRLDTALSGLGQSTAPSPVLHGQQRTLPVMRKK